MLPIPISKILVTLFEKKWNLMCPIYYTLDLSTMSRPNFFFMKPLAAGMDG